MKEAARYLGLRETDEKTEREIEEAEKNVSSLLPVKTVACFDIEKNENGIKLVGTDVTLCGNLAKKHFSDCKKILAVLATLGLKSETMLKRAFALSALKGVVLDAVFTAKIEEYLDETEKEVRSVYGSLTTRISCGYGDLPIATQKELFKLLDGERIGVSVNECYMLVPNKSVIALIGVR